MHHDITFEIAINNSDALSTSNNRSLSKHTIKSFTFLSPITNGEDEATFTIFMI